jgi:prefoldin subunit 5
MAAPELEALNTRLQTLQRRLSDGDCTADELAAYIQEIDQKKRELSEVRGKMYSMYINLKLREMYEGSRRK